MDTRTIQGLYNLSHCYVHPARGEGFGLPVAEAMAAGVPVISVAYSGLADFVSDETASTIPFQLEPAETHFEIPYSVWAEPDRDQLAAQLRDHVEGVNRRRSPSRSDAPEISSRPSSLGRLLQDGGMTS